MGGTWSGGLHSWTSLPQGFHNCVKIFGKGFVRDLVLFSQENPDISLLQYADDLLAAKMREMYQMGAGKLLAPLQDKEYQMCSSFWGLCL